MAEKLYIILCFAGLLLLCCLGGCSTVNPSKAITDATTEEIRVIQKQIDSLNINTPKECKTALENGLNSIREQLTGVSKQVENIKLACESEKTIIKKDVANRDIIILCLLGIIGVYIALKLKHKLKI